MTEKSKAQRLADILQHKIPSIECLEQSAAELRRLDALNAELVEALTYMVIVAEEYKWPVKGEHLMPMTFARAALAKAKEQT